MPPNACFFFERIYLESGFELKVWIGVCVNARGPWFTKVHLYHQGRVAIPLQRRMQHPTLADLEASLWPQPSALAPAMKP